MDFASLALHVDDDLLRLKQSLSQTNDDVITLPDITPQYKRSTGQESAYIYADKIVAEIVQCNSKSVSDDAEELYLVRKHKVVSVLKSLFRNNCIDNTMSPDEIREVYVKK